MAKHVPAMIQVIETNFADAKLFVPDIFEDDRGLLTETFSAEKYAQLGLRETFVQDLVTWTAQNTIRGLHYDPRMAKFVQVLKGRVYDVIVDMREDSATYKKWQGFYLSDYNHHQLFIPSNFAHGYLTLTQDVVFYYKMTAQHDLQYERRINWRDPSIGIEWPVSGNVRISHKDDMPP